MFMVIYCHESGYFEDILKLWIFRLRTFYNFFQVWETEKSQLLVMRLWLGLETNNNFVKISLPILYTIETQLGRGRGLENGT